MKRITTVLRESEAMIVRKAVCVAGGEHVVITPIPYRVRAVDMAEIRAKRTIHESCKQVRFDVTAEDSMAGSVIEVIRRIAQAGRIDLASFQHCTPKRAA
ncbi:hypothetical protein [Sideroxydans sp. CL21]|uniref:hypothetical protein n=1 Tax=Sideroxydans sp. CL21 TaxID=2600596 RepID=UPI0024BC4DFC|nr:hypothetical protein [Sideroxydans sp. CL21]